MKNLSGILSIVLAFITFYLFMQAQDKLDLVLAFCCMLMSIIFLLFSIMEEQKEEIERLRKGISAYQKSMEHSKGYSPSEKDLELIGASTLSEGSVMNMFKDRKGRRWFSITKPERF
jgi:hypothetical protein